MAAADYYTQVYTMFVGYFGRPPAQSGLDYYANLVNAAGGKLDAVLDDFHKAAESQALFAGKSIEQQVNIIFQNLFGRDAAPTGLNYWAGEIAAGRLALSQAAYAIAQGAQTADKGVLTAKIDSAKLWVAGLDTTTEILTFSTEAGRTAGRDFLKTITTSTPAAQTAVDAALTTMVNSGNTNPGQTYTLTTTIDNFPGTAGNDTFIGDNATASNADQINGGAGVDTVKLYGTTTKPQMSGVEHIYLSAPAGDFDVSTVSGLLSLEVEAEPLAAARNFTLGSAQALKLTNIAGGSANDIVVKQSAALTSLDLTVNGLGSATSGNVDVDVNGSGVTTLNLTTATKDSYVELVNTGGKLKTIKVTGDKAVTIDADTGNIGLTTVDASAQTAGGVVIALDVTTNKDVTFSGGKGNDAVLFGDSFDANDTATGGDGTDTIGISDGADLTEASGKKATGFEYLDVRGGTGTFDMDWLAGISNVVVGAALTANTVVTDMSTATGVIIKSDLGAFLLTAQQKDAGAGSPDDALAITVDGATSITMNASSQIIVDDIETLTVNTTSIGSSVTHTIDNLKSDESTKIVINASTAKAVINELDAAALVAFDAAGSAKAVELTVGAHGFTSASGVGFTGGAGNDKFVLTAVSDFSSTANAAIVIVTGGKGGDTTTLAADDGANVADGHTDGETYTFKFADGDSVSKASVTAGYDADLTDIIQGIDAAAAFVAGTDAAGNKLTLDTAQTATAVTFSTTAVTFGTTTVNNAFDFYVFENNTGEANTAYVYQDTDGDKVIEAGEFAVKLVGNAVFATGEFAVVGGNLVFTSA